MNCSEIQQRIDDIVDDDLNEWEQAACRSHLAGCVSCASAINQRLSLKTMLTAFKQEVPEQNPALVERIIDATRNKTVGQRRIQQRSSGDSAGRLLGIPLGLLSGIAASVVVLVIAGLLLYTAPHPSDISADLKAYQLPALNQLHTVSLLFHSSRHIDDVTFSIAVPRGVELQGFTGQQELVWNGVLKQGKNVLSLPMIAHTTISGELIMSLQHGKETKAFRVLLEVGRKSSDVSQHIVPGTRWV